MQKMSSITWTKALNVSDLLETMNGGIITKKHQAYKNKRYEMTSTQKANPKRNKSNDSQGHCYHSRRLNLDLLKSQKDFSNSLTSIDASENINTGDLRAKLAMLSLDTEIKQARAVLSPPSAHSHERNPLKESFKKVTVQSEYSGKVPCKLRYHHGSSHTSVESFPVVGTAENSDMDSIDYVYEANRPENLKLPSLSFTSRFSPETKISNLCLNRKESSWKILKEKFDDSMLNNNMHPEIDKISEISENLDNDARLYSTSSSESSFYGGDNSYIKIPKNRDSIVDPNIYKDAYIAALKQARIKYFKHIPFERMLTRSFTFSYFDSALTANSEKGDTFDGMKLIFDKEDPKNFIAR